MKTNTLPWEVHEAPESVGYWLKADNTGAPADYPHIDIEELLDRAVNLRLFGTVTIDGTTTGYAPRPRPVTEEHWDDYEADWAWVEICEETQLRLRTYLRYRRNQIGYAKAHEIIETASHLARLIQLPEADEAIAPDSPSRQLRTLRDTVADGCAALTQLWSVESLCADLGVERHPTGVELTARDLVALCSARYPLFASIRHGEMATDAARENLVHYVSQCDARSVPSRVAEAHDAARRDIDPTTTDIEIGVHQVSLAELDRLCRDMSASEIAEFFGVDLRTVAIALTTLVESQR